MEDVAQSGRRPSANLGEGAPEDATGLVFNVQRFSLHDGPGARTTVFLKGCPLACQWCHNPESRGTRPELSVVAERCIQCGSCVLACTHEAVVRVADGAYSVDHRSCVRCGACTEACPTGGREIIGVGHTVRDVLEKVEPDRVFYEESGGGVSFSGGEPLAQPTFLLALLEACRARRLHTVVDTCGMAPESSMRAVAELADLFLYDLKLMDDRRHRMFTGVGNRQILRNLEVLAELDAEVWVRLPLIPGVNDDEENLDALAAFVARIAPGYPVHILPYHAIARAKYERSGHHGQLEGFVPPGNEEVAAAAERLRKSGLRVIIGG